MRVLNRIILSISLFSLPVFAICQDTDKDKEELGNPTLHKERKFDWSKAYFGGNIGAAFSQSNFYGSLLWLDFSPDFAYQIHPRIMLGSGITYQLTQYFSPATSFHVIGGRVYSRIFVWDGLFAQLEGIVLNSYVDFDRNFVPINRRVTNGNFLVGGGYRYMTGNNAYISFVILMPTIRNDIYPERTPFVNFGFGIGIR
jgi:hypothetical protein